MKLLIPLLFLCLSLESFAKSFVEEGIYVFDQNKKHLQQILNQGELTVDHPDSFGYEVYGPKGLSIWAKQQQLEFISLEQMQNAKHNKSVSAYSGATEEYATPEEIEFKLHSLAALYPQILQLFSIGQSVEGRQLWMMKISDNVELDETEPEFKYIANMHGDEITGREMMVKLIEDMAAAYYQNDRKIKKLIDNTEIFIMPSMNPDGAAGRHRGNGNYADLNRDFPDFINDPYNTFDNREPETIAIMEFQAQHQFALSANLHGGAIVVNYPWDSTVTRFPFNDLVISMSKKYASPIPEMFNSTEFFHGITNGYAWYCIHGGMQDYSYYWHNDMQLTLEVSQFKWPNYARTEELYQQHKPSLLNYISTVHQGAGFHFKQNEITGVVEIARLELDKTTTFIPVPKFNTLGTFAFDHSEFYHVLEGGFYLFTITTDQGEKIKFTRMVIPGMIGSDGNYKQL